MLEHGSEPTLREALSMRMELWRLRLRNNVRELRNDVLAFQRNVARNLLQSEAAEALGVQITSEDMSELRIRYQCVPTSDSGLEELTYVQNFQPKPQDPDESLDAQAARLEQEMQSMVSFNQYVGLLPPGSTILMTYIGHDDRLLGSLKVVKPHPSSA